MPRLYPGMEFLHKRWGLGVITVIPDKVDQKILSVRFWKDAERTALGNTPHIMSINEGEIVEEVPPWKIFKAMYAKEILMCVRCQEYQHGLISKPCVRNTGIMMFKHNQRADPWCPLIKE